MGHQILLHPRKLSIIKHRFAYPREWLQFDEGEHACYYTPQAYKPQSARRTANRGGRGLSDFWKAALA